MLEEKEIYLSIEFLIFLVSFLFHFLWLCTAEVNVLVLSFDIFEQLLKQNEVLENKNENHVHFQILKF